MNKDKELTPGELDYVTPCEDNIYTISIRNATGDNTEFKVDKSKTFKVLLFLIEEKPNLYNKY